jgi:tRNA (guanine37-N1)-methyltransferase
MHFYIITLFPEVIFPYVESSILGKAMKNNKISVTCVNPRDFTTDKHHKADDRAYGGGPGMVMKAEPVLKAIKKIKGRKKDVKIVLFSPGGKAFDSTVASKYAKKHKHIILVCGHYEGIDSRVQKIYKTDDLSIGPYTLTGGELPALAVVDAVARNIPEILGNASSLEETRNASPEMYTRPEVLKWGGKNYRVPKVLLSGNHKDIEDWREKKRGK